MIRPLHPFPARMAPDLAIAELKKLDEGSMVLDPMAGSGTVLRQASELGHRAIGFDMDPLAVLMSRVWTTRVDDTQLDSVFVAAMKKIRKLRGASVVLPWIDDDLETAEYVRYWFAQRQRTDLRRIAYTLSEMGRRKVNSRTSAALDVLRVALSRIIITKDQGASLARDVSHSRPHKVGERSDFDVVTAFERSVTVTRRMLLSAPPPGHVSIQLGDARKLKSVGNKSVDLVLTSPPYLNAIDYLRGHRLSLVWLGHRLVELREIRSHSIGAERGPDSTDTSCLFEDIVSSMVRTGKLSRRHLAMISRYAEDVYRMMSEIARVLKPRGRAVLVVGNSCLKGAFVRNSDGVVKAASMVGLRVRRQVERKLPESKRYLPPPSAMNRALGKRMRTETILTFCHR